LKILVTGANGLLGSNLVRQLLKNGHEIIAFVLKNSNTSTLNNLPLKIVAGNILSLEDLRSASKGVEAIFHLAASTSLWPERDELINKINIDGTQNIIQLATEIHVKRLVYVGTASSFSFGTKIKPGVEDTEYSSHTYGFNYMDSKYEAQKNVLKAYLKGLPVIVVNPTFMLGKYDSGPSSGAMIIGIYNKKVPGFPPGGKNYVCVKDAAVGIANALEMGKLGECYIIGNENLSYTEAFQKIGKIVNIAPPTVKFPTWIVLLFGRFNSYFSKISGKKPSVSYGLARISCDEHYFSSAKAVRELKLPQSPIEEGIKECFDWLKENDYIK